MRFATIATFRDIGAVEIQQKCEPCFLWPEWRWELRQTKEHGWFCWCPFFGSFLWASKEMNIKRQKF